MRGEVSSPLGHSIVGTSQSSWFGFCDPLPRCEQRPKGPVRSNPESGLRALVVRPFAGTFLVSVFQGRAEMSEGGGRCCGRGSCLPWLPSFPVLPLYIFQLQMGGDNGEHKHIFTPLSQTQTKFPLLPPFLNSLSPNSPHYPGPYSGQWS